VFIRRHGHVPALSPLYEGPYRVLARNDRVFYLQLGFRVDSVSVSRLKPAFLPAGAGPALPPALGRPPRAPSHVAALPGPGRDKLVKRVSFWIPH
jgi:hypothetical protein